MTYWFHAEYHVHRTPSLSKSSTDCPTKNRNKYTQPHYFFSYRLLIFIFISIEGKGISLEKEGAC